MWFKLAGATFENNLGTMESISKSYLMNYSNLTGLSASPHRVSFTDNNKTPNANIVFTVKDGYVLKKDTVVTASGGAVAQYTATQDLSAGDSFTISLTGISSTVTFSGAAELIL